MLSRRSRAVSVKLDLSSVGSSESARARSAWLAISATRFTSSSTRLLSGDEGGLTVGRSVRGSSANPPLAVGEPHGDCQVSLNGKEAEHEASGGHVGDRVPVRGRGRAGGRLRDQATPGG